MFVQTTSFACIERTQQLSPRRTTASDGDGDGEWPNTTAQPSVFLSLPDLVPVRSIALLCWRLPSGLPSKPATVQNRRTSMRHDMTIRSRRVKGPSIFKRQS